MLKAVAAIVVLVIAGASESASSVGWPSYGADYGNQRHAALQQITAANVNHLTPVWRFILGPHERVESTPIVIGRTLYVTTGVGDNVVALDAATGKLKWRYRPTIGFIYPCCGAINRGVAVENGRVFIATLDAQLIALNSVTGKPVWNTRIDDPHKGFSETMAPLAWNGMVFIGSSGSEFGIRGSLTAYRASDGKKLWRWYAVSPGWEGAWTANVHGLSLHRDIAAEKKDAKKYRDSWTRGGGAIWMTPALDPKRGVIYATTSNPSPTYDGSTRPGDNLYTECIVAIDAQSGKLLWYYQQTPHDIREYEPSSPPVLFDALDEKGRSIPALAQAGKTQWLYIVDRRTGRLVRLSHSLTYNANAYSSAINRAARKVYEMNLPLRGSVGPIAYDPRRHLAFVTSMVTPLNVLENWNEVLTAVDVNNGSIAWQRTLGAKHHDVRGDVMLGGPLSAGDVVFVADASGVFYALEASSGSILLRQQVGVEQTDANDPGIVHFAHVVADMILQLKRALFHKDPPFTSAARVDGNPIAYEIDGTEYIALGYDAHPESATGGAVISAFALPRK